MTTKEVMEIERKWVLKGVPTLIQPIKAEEVAYIYVGDDRYTEIFDIESGTPSFWVVTKEGEGLMRKETVKEISEDAYKEVYRSNTRPVLRKYRSIYSLPEGRCAVVDEFHDMLLVTMEVEILVPLTENYEAAAEEFRNREIPMPPEISREIIAEVTDIEGFKNKNLYLSGG